MQQMKMYSSIRHKTGSSLENCMSVTTHMNITINYGSFLMMRVVNIKKDIKDKTLTIPSNILVASNADFDGDLFNIFRIIGEYFNKEFSRCLNPRYNLYISRINGKVNMEAVPLKDEAAAFYQFNNL